MQTCPKLERWGESFILKLSHSHFSLISRTFIEGKISPPGAAKKYFPKREGQVILQEQLGEMGCQKSPEKFLNGQWNYEARNSIDAPLTGTIKLCCQ